MMSPLIRRTIFFAFFILFITPSFAAHDPYTFAPSEHIYIGDNIKLYFTPNDTGQTGHVFHLPNGLPVTYGDIISLGDFYLILGQPVSHAKSESERKARFLAAFNSFARSTEAVSEVKQILDVIHNEKKAVDDALKRGEKPESVYQRLGKDNNRQYNCITGGGCSPSTWWVEPGRYLKLTKENYDHFGSNAWVTYQTGHDLAMEQAILAYQAHDLKKLELAYAINAFACHFLTDRFSAGHVRTPREELVAQVTPGDIGSLLSNYMHNEENINSIHVHNLRGNRWVAYGDASYLNINNNENRTITQEAAQLSVNHLFTAYQTGIPQEENSLYALIPFADEIGDASYRDISPLFYWDNPSQKLMRRENVENVYDRHWTSDWWGWSTFVLLSKQRGLPTRTQAELALSGYGEQAMQEGLITDKDVLNYIKSQSRKKMNDAIA